MNVKIYTDGACSGNPGPGGYGVAICSDYGIEELSGFESETTNNRMELKAVVKAIEKVHEMIFQDKVKTNKLEIFSDSAYVINAVNKKWLDFWCANGFKTVKGKDVKNSDLWKELMECLCTSQFINLELDFIKVKGHSGNYFNEKVDALAKNEINKNVK